jgi:hypothetical protein
LVLDKFAALAKEPGQEALARRLAGRDGPNGYARPRGACRWILLAVLPLQPATATGTRDTLLRCGGRLPVAGLAAGLQSCLCPTVKPAVPYGRGRSSARTIPGEEAMLFLQRSTDYTEIAGLYLDDQGVAQYRSATRPDGRVIDADAAQRLMESYRETPPPVTAVQMNQLGTGSDGLMILP